jgi:hypothetical protein
MPRPGKWKSLKIADDEQEYLVLLSYLPLKKVWMIPKFLWNTSKIERQLTESKGLMGYALHAEFLAKRFWTLSVWEDESSLRAFVSHLPHSQTMIELAPHMASTKFTRWKVKGSALPANWDDAKRRMRHDARSGH